MNIFQTICILTWLTFHTLLQFRSTAMVQKAFRKYLATGRNICWNSFGLDILSSNDSENVLQFGKCKEPGFKHTHTETDYMWLCMFVWTLRNRSLCWVDTLLLVVVVVVVNVGPIAYVLALQFNKFHFACPENCYTPYTRYFTLYHTQNSPATHTHIHNQTTTLRMLMLELQFRCASSVPCRKPVNKHC